MHARKNEAPDDNAGVRESALRFARATRRFGPHIISGAFNPGFCPICERRTVFIKEDPWLRDSYRCWRCDSIPRWRAVVYVLERAFPRWRDLRLLEWAPGGPASLKLQAECGNYVGTHYYPDVPAGSVHDGYRSENLERTTFDDGEFDLVVSQDVFEHILNPGRAFAEIARILRPGGAHLFTVPYYSDRRSVVRAVEEEGEVRHLLEPDYHLNPVDPEGSLVVTEWGTDLIDVIYRASGLVTTIELHADRRLGLDAAFLEVFVSRKPLEPVEARSQ